MTVNVKPSDGIKEDLLGESAMNNAVNICHNIQVTKILHSRAINMIGTQKDFKITLFIIWSGPKKGRLV